MAFRVNNKIKNTASRLKSWNRQCFGNFKTQIRDTEKDLSTIQADFTRNPSKENFDRELIHKKRLEFLLECEQVFWAQRAKQMWLIKGERNTKYFHSVVRHRRSKAKIMAVQDITGVWKNKEEILDAGLVFFKDLFKATNQSSLEAKKDLIQRANVVHLNDYHLDTLRRPFTNF